MEFGHPYSKPEHRVLAELCAYATPDASDRRTNLTNYDKVALNKGKEMSYQRVFDIGIAADWAASLFGEAHCTDKTPYFDEETGDVELRSNGAIVLTPRIPPSR